MGIVERRCSKNPFQIASSNYNGIGFNAVSFYLEKNVAEMNLIGGSFMEKAGFKKKHATHTQQESKSKYHLLGFSLLKLCKKN